MMMMMISCVSTMIKLYCRRYNSDDSKSDPIHNQGRIYDVFLLDGIRDFEKEIKIIILIFDCSLSLSFLKTINESITQNCSIFEGIICREK